MRDSEIMKDSITGLQFYFFSMTNQWHSSRLRKTYIVLTRANTA